MLSAAAALDRLREGNRRFAGGAAARAAQEVRPADIAGRQRPFAIIHGCSDSRVPAEIIFDQGLGDLFVIRVAGNVVAPSQIGSVEFAATAFGTELVVVLGHTDCGLVISAVEELRNPAVSPSRNFRSIVDLVRPSVETSLKAPGVDDHDALVRLAVRENIRRSVQQLRRGSDVLEQLIDRGRLQIVGAEYALKTGTVEFLAD